MISANKVSEQLLMTHLVSISADQVQEALRLWHGGETSTWPLAQLRLGLQVTTEQELFGSLADSGVAAQNRAILSLGLEQLRAINPENEELLRQRYEHRQDVMVVANSMNKENYMGYILDKDNNFLAQETSRPAMSKSLVRILKEML